MPTFLASLMTIATVINAQAQDLMAEGAPTRAIDLSTPAATAQSMMDAMYLGDADRIDQIFLPDGQLRRVTATGEMRPDGLGRWRAWVGEQAVGDADEEIFEVEVEQFGHLATVWAPFVIHYRGELVGCGVNQLSMAKLGEEWRVVFAMDTQHDDDCATFRDEYSSTRD